MPRVVHAGLRVEAGLWDRAHGSRPASSHDDGEESMMNQDIKTSNLDSIACVFRPATPIIGGGARLSKRWDSEYDVFRNQIHAAYKRKADKIQLVDQADSSGDCLTRITDWKQKILNEKLRPTLQRGPNLDSFSDIITPKFFKIARGSRLTPSNAVNLKIGPHLTTAEREILMAVLFN